MNRYQLIFSDIDGTLLDSKQHIRPKTKEYILKLSAAGIPFILVSGRMPPSVANIQRKIGLSAPFISYSGALMHDENGRTIWDKPMNLKTAVLIRERITAFSSNVVSYTFSADSWITDKDDGTAALYLEKETTDMRPLVGRPQDVLNENAPVHKVLCTGDERLMDELQDRLHREFPSCTIFKSMSRYLEIMSAEASKSAAAAFLCRRLNIDAKNVIAFGDNFNDTDLLEYAGLGVAMGNAPDPVKRAADLVAPTNDEEGLRFVLEKLSIKG